MPFENNFYNAFSIQPGNPYGNSQVPLWNQLLQEAPREYRNDKKQSLNQYLKGQNNKLLKDLTMTLDVKVSNSINKSELREKIDDFVISLGQKLNKFNYEV